MRVSPAFFMVGLALAVCSARADDAYQQNTLPSQAALNGHPVAGVQTQSPASANAATLSPPDSALYGPVYGAAPAAQRYQQPYQSLPNAGNAAAQPPDIVMPALGNRLIESSWYSRVDYFNWKERLDNFDLVNEYGTLMTFGYARRVGIERFRAEVFGATMRYKGFGQFDDGTMEPLSALTGYIGVLGEYDLHIEPDWMPAASFFAGLGTRFWVRDIKDGITDFGNPSLGYTETWWTFYPYLGIEKRRNLSANFEFYGSARIGCTAFTYEHATWGDTSLYPKAGLLGQLEGGVRGRTAFVSLYTQAMNWGESDTVRGLVQPYSQMFTIGLEGGFCF